MRPAAGSALSHQVRRHRRFVGAAAFLCLLSFGLTGRTNAQTALNFEAASMSPVGTGATVSTSSDPNVTGGLLEFLNSTAVGQSMTLMTPSIPAGTYQVQFRYKTNTSRGQHTVTIDGTQLGGTIDQYATTSTYPTATLGNVSFAATGTHTIVLTVTGKDAAATKFYITADKFIFTPVAENPTAPTFSPPGGLYTSPQSVSISSSSGANIRYTTDGSTPSETNGPIYSGPVSINTTTTLQAIAFETGSIDSPVTSETYTINTGSGGTFNFEAASMSPVGTGATVSMSSDSNVTGGLLEFLNSTAAGQSMTLTTPSIPAGTYQVQFRYKTNTSRGQHTVKIDGTQLGGTIDQYATTSTYPTATLGNVTFATTSTHTIVLTVTGKDAAATKFYITADKFTLIGQSSGGQVAAPSFTPVAGTYTSAQNVSISSATPNANIRYTTDGVTTPTETVGTLYSGLINISSGTVTLQAIAYETGMTDSAVTSASYTISTGGGGTVAAPTFSLPGGTYTSAQSVSISSATPSALIRYTTDGSTPSETAGLAYSDPVSISSGTVLLQAIAYEAGITDSTVTGETYTISSGNIVSLFDGTDLNGWTQKPLNSWTVNTTDVAMASLGSGRGFIYANNTYRFYRLQFEVRHLGVTGGNKDHKSCMVFFGTSPSLDAMGGIQFQYPNGGDWDYRPGVNKGGGPHFTVLPHPTLDSLQWVSIELLVDGRNGTARLAEAQPVGTKATEVMDFNDPTEAIQGYFAFQMHNSGLLDEYRNVTIEINPAVDDLITTK
jgi:hypothetical protein